MLTAAGERVQARAGAAGQDDPLHWASLTRDLRAAGRFRAFSRPARPPVSGYDSGMLRRFRTPLLLLAALLIALPGPAAETHPFSIHDTCSPWTASPTRRCRPTARWCVRRATTDVAANKGRTDLWGPRGGRRPTAWTTHEAGDSNPRWSPDGKRMYFLSTRSGGSQVWNLPLRRRGESR